MHSFKTPLLILLVFLSVGPLMLFGQNAKGAIGENLSPAASGEQYAVLIGISKYKNLPPLDFADVDAKYFANFLISHLGLKQENVKLFLNDTATLDILLELNSLKKKVNAGDRVYIYFSGHGDIETEMQQGGLLLLYESNAKNYYLNPNGYIQESQIKAAITQLTAKAAEVVFIADACHSGKLSGGEDGKRDNMLALQASWGKEVKIFSCQPDQTSLEGRQWGNGRGLFSWELVKGLNGAADGAVNGEPADKKVSLRELQTYLQDKVPNEAKPNNQLPFTIGNPYIILANTAGNTTADKQLVVEFSGDKGKKGVQNNAGLTGEQAVTYQKFNEALHAAEKAAGKGEAMRYLDLMKGQDFPKETLESCTRALIATLLKQSTALINPLLTGGDVVTSKEEIESTIDNLQGALGLLGTDHYLWPAFESRRLFLKSVALTLSETEAAKKEINNQAIQLLEQSIKLEPYAYYSYFQLGVCYYRKKLPEKAIEYFDKYKSYLPKDADTYNNIGLAYFKLGDLQQAVKFIAQAVGIDSTKYAYYFNMGNVMCVGQNYAKGIYAYRKALQFKPNAVDVLFNLANAFNYAHQIDSSIKYYRLVLKINPADDVAWLYLGNAQRKVKKYDDALASYSMSLKQGNNSARVYYNMACIFSLKADKENSLQFFEESLKRGMSDFVLEIYKEPELANLRSYSKFSQLMKKYASK